MPLPHRRSARSARPGIFNRAAQFAASLRARAGLSVVTPIPALISTSSLLRVAAMRPRYLLHGSALAVGALALAIVAAQPRPATVAEITLDSDTSLALLVEPRQPAPEQAAGEESEPQAEAKPTSAPPPGPRTHTVEDGESLRMLAAKYGVSPETIMAANAIQNPDFLQLGQELVVLPSNGVLHTLQKGQMLRQVAEAYEVPLSDILAANDLGSNPDLVVEGATLFVPGAEPLVRSPRLPGMVGADGEQTAASQSAGSLPARRVAPSPRSYEVQKGDTLAGIAEIFGVDVATVLATNGITDPDTIRPGTELRILPVKGIEYEVEPGETLADIAWRYQTDLGLLLDYNDLDNPDIVRVGTKLVLPGAQRRVEAAPPAPAAPAPAVAPAAPKPAAQAAPKPAAPIQTAPKPAAPAPKPVPAPTSGGGGASVVSRAMQFRGYPYVFGGTSPAGFDCSGFVYYVHNNTGNPVGRGMWQQLNGGPRIASSDLLPGDTVFFANTYMPGLSHNGIYVGGGQFVHASDPSTGIVVSSMNSAYWSSRYVGATRLWD